MQDTKVLTYADRVSTVALWWKAFLLLPIWAYIVLPIWGTIATFFGSAVDEFGYSLVLIWGAVNFVEDVLKQKIKFTDSHVFWGLRSYPLAELSSVGLSYSPNQVLPSHFVLNFASNRAIKLKLTRLKAQDSEVLLRLVEHRLPDCKIDPMVRMLGKCRKLARTNPNDETNRVVIPYNSHRLLFELKDSFLATLYRWSRLGPVLAFLFVSPIWLASTHNFYSMTTNWAERQKSVIFKFMMEIGTKVSGMLGEQAGHMFSASMEYISKNPLVLIAFMLAVPFFFYGLLKMLLKPNLLTLAPEGLQFSLEVFGQTLYSIKKPWTIYTSARLFKPAGAAGPESWKVRLHSKNGKQDELLELAAVSAADRVRLVSGLERMAPDCSIESELTEAMMPKQQRSYTELWLQSLTTPPERKSLEPLTPGQVLGEGRYEVLKRLGTGGQGLAYLCKERNAANQETGQEVVLKETILPVYGNQTLRQQALERFQQEAKLLVQFDSDRIVKLIDHFVEDHRGYLVLEHIDGRNLKQVVQENGPISEELVHALALQMCDVLRYLHGKGVVHRDFTPDNLILSNSGKLKLIDFNVAHQLESGTTGTVVGKHAYLPPEQIRGQASMQSDIYTMGATMSFLLSGQEPEPIAVADVRKLGCDVSFELNSIIRKCTALSCAKRFDSVEALRAALLGEGEIDDNVSSAKQAGLLQQREASASDGLSQQPETVGDDCVVSLAREREPVILKREQTG
jgi:tRNA A-37 threonylcarbamoyl transferase component Bud32